MYANIESSEFVVGVLEFCSIAFEHQIRMGRVGFYCPRVKCGNLSNLNSVDILKEHILQRGYRPQYHIWVWHGEERVYEEKSVDENVNGDVNEDVDCVDGYETDEENVNEDVNRVDDMMDGVKDELRKHPRVFDLLTEASHQPLYPRCTKFTKLTVVLTISNIKSKVNWSDTSFTMLLEALDEMLTDGNELPKSTYYSKKLMCPFGFEYLKIHGCPNDCVLYQNENENLKECPRCELSRYKCKGARDTKGPSAKVLWYLPIILKFKRLFSIKKDASNLGGMQIG
ncbi:uncharacterized protein LOC130823836 [Amaranthus tricolor]|uniref:uncharacterized protein LOC130823836 n=1 Tax=Amaranthus tricolor TaxID=29722 RepID=UPI00258F4C02|nr:uncharacterized protein LOC130823836 [Amaranthus tricolor]